MESEYFICPLMPEGQKAGGGRSNLGADNDRPTSKSYKTKENMLEKINLSNISQEGVCICFFKLTGTTK